MQGKRKEQQEDREEKDYFIAKIMGILYGAPSGEPTEIEKQERSLGIESDFAKFVLKGEDPSDPFLRGVMDNKRNIEKQKKIYNESPTEQNLSNLAAYTEKYERYLITAANRKRHATERAMSSPDKHVDPAVAKKKRIKHKISGMKSTNAKEKEGLIEKNAGQKIQDGIPKVLAPKSRLR